MMIKGKCTCVSVSVSVELVMKWVLVLGSADEIDVGVDGGTVIMIYDLKSRKDENGC